MTEKGAEEQVLAMERLQTIDPFSQINSAARKDYTTDPGCVFKHGTPPVRYGSEECLKCHWRSQSEMTRSG